MLVKTAAIFDLTSAGKRSAMNGTLNARAIALDFLARENLKHSRARNTGVAFLGRINGFMILPFFFTAHVVCWSGSRKRRRTRGEKVLRLIQDPFSCAEFGRIYANLSRKFFAGRRLRLQVLQTQSALLRRVRSKA